MNGVQRSSKDQTPSVIGYKKMIDCGFFLACSLRVSIMHIPKVSRALRLLLPAKMFPLQKRRGFM